MSFPSIYEASQEDMLKSCVLHSLALKSFVLNCGSLAGCDKEGWSLASVGTQSTVVAKKIARKTAAIFTKPKPQATSARSLSLCELERVAISSGAPDFSPTIFCRNLLTQSGSSTIADSTRVRSIDTSFRRTLLN